MQLRKITECSCNICKDLCKKSPCMGTPADIQKIIDAGYKDKLMITIWVDQKKGNTPLPAVAPILGEKGCVFQDSQGLCELHTSGLKPTEGKLAIHNMEDGGLRRTVGYTWISEAGIKVFEQFGGYDLEQLKKVVRQMIPFFKQGKIELIAAK